MSNGKDKEIDKIDSLFWIVLYQKISAKNDETDIKIEFKHLSEENCLQKTCNHEKMSSLEILCNMLDGKKLLQKWNIRWKFLTCLSY